MFKYFRTKGQNNITYDQFLMVMKELGGKRFGKNDEEKIFSLVDSKSPLAVGTTVSKHILIHQSRGARAKI